MLLSRWLIGLRLTAFFLGFETSATKVPHPSLVEELGGWHEEGGALDKSGPVSVCQQHSKMVFPEALDVHVCFTPPCLISSLLSLRSKRRLWVEVPLSPCCGRGVSTSSLATGPSEHSCPCGSSLGLVFSCIPKVNLVCSRTCPAAHAQKLGIKSVWLH